MQMSKAWWLELREDWLNTKQSPVEVGAWAEIDNKSVIILFISMTNLNTLLAKYTLKVLQKIGEYLLLKDLSFW